MNIHIEITPDELRHLLSPVSPLIGGIPAVTMIGEMKAMLLAEDQTNPPPKNKGGRPRKLPLPTIDDEEDMPNQSEMDSLIFKLGAFLRFNGPKRVDTLTRELNTQREVLDKLLQSPWFEKHDRTTWTLSGDGFAHFSEAPEEK